MENKDLEAFVERRIVELKRECHSMVEKQNLQTKLEITEYRFRTFLWLGAAALTIFGAVIPLWFSYRASDRLDTALIQMKQDLKTYSQEFRTESSKATESVDKTTQAIRFDVRADREFQARQMNIMTGRVDDSIEKMRNQVQAAIGAQLKKPLLECLTDGVSIEGKRIDVIENRLDLAFKNTGDAPAHNMSVSLYLPADFCRNIANAEVSDEPAYPCLFHEYGNPFISPQQISNQSYDVGSAKPGHYPALLRIFYDQEPRKYSFFVNIKGH